ncbi:sensor histidine kinase [Natronomonas marina]|uniref:sensor histidine kinase n=1 Tax=Natronomonas marina TaxID=2961939 RepID=UPI0020C9CE17|nr:HAMP domain-containing sensor histidine kinase [Natronomonas marina]
MGGGNRWPKIRAGLLNVPAWVVSGIGLVLAGLSLWYLIVVRAYYVSGGLLDPTPAVVLELIEISLLGGFSLVLVYAGYWLASSQFDRRRLWWAGLWTLIGLTGILAIVVLVNSMQLVQGESLSEPTFIQTILLAAGGGAIAGLLIGISTVKETVEAQRAERQRDTLLFVNELLRHNVLNGMQVVKGNSELLKEHVDEEGRPLLETTNERAESIVELVRNVRVLVDSVSRAMPLRDVELATTVGRTVSESSGAYPDAEFEVDVPADLAVRGDDLLGAVLENLLANAVDHNDAETPRVVVTAERDGDVVELRVSDNGPGIPADERERYFEAGQQDDSSVGQGLGLYLVETLVERYGGDVWITDNDPRGTTVGVELRRAGG